MNPIFQFELKHNSKHWVSGLTALILIFIGGFCGNKFNLSAGDGIYLNSPYTIGFMMGMLSLSVIFFAILFSNQLLFKEWDAKFDTMFFALPFSKGSYLQGKFGFFFVKTFLSFTLLIVGFIIGQNLRMGSEIQPIFNAWHYLYPLIIFGLLNSFFVCSFLFFIAYTAQKKLLVVLGGLLLYVLYMVLLVFSNSPFMSSSLPQSLEAQQISALLDPFGLSAYFFEARTFSVLQKNTGIVPVSGMLLLNRLIVVLTSGLFLWISYRRFSLTSAQSHKSKKKPELKASGFSYRFIEQVEPPKRYFGSLASLKSIQSFAKTDLTYLFKSITIVAVSVLLVFYVGMEMYAEIDKGIRLPEKYASSGLMANAISENFYLFGLLILVYFINDLFWRSHTSGFDWIEKSTYFSKNKLKGHFVSISILISFFTLLLIAEGLLFQFSYGYPTIDWNAYLGVVVFNMFPLILFAAFLLLINDRIGSRFVGLGVSTLVVFVLATPLLKMILPYPLFQIFSGFKGVYSDFNGYGIYLVAFARRLVFGVGLVAVLWSLNEFFKTKSMTVRKVIVTFILVGLGIYSGILFMSGYNSKNEEQLMLEAKHYEQDFRKYLNLPQPTIIHVSTDIELYPSNNAYQIQGEYVLKNNTNRPISSILLNFHPDLKIESATFKYHNKRFKVDDYVTEIQLRNPLLPDEMANLDFELSYKWVAVNGHQSFNAIIKNGSFMRISNYFPGIGYQINREVDDEQKRKEFQLGQASGIKKLDAPETFKNDFLTLDMTVSTEATQIAVGTGDMVKKWSENNRNYFNYKAVNIPFRFAVSSAVYEHKTVRHKDIDINVYYTKDHFENVEHLLENAKLTLDYCTDNFGPYPFKSITFAEVSAFTKGFAATAYPWVVFMTEDMIFHTNIQEDKKQDVINELAGHELSHLWWGNSQINPDDREGASMLTETLAMYTEMMLYKKMYGQNEMKERLKIHQQIYDSEKGLRENQPLYKVRSGNSHIAYSKGAVVMVELSELIGEEQVNRALKNFLINNQYPKKPTSLDLLNEFYQVAPNQSIKTKIDNLFKTQ